MSISFAEISILISLAALFFSSRADRRQKEAQEREAKSAVLHVRPLIQTRDEELMKDGERDFNRFWEKMPRSLGNKRKQIPENGENKGIGFITKLYGAFAENEFVKILPNEFFGYHRITVEQPLLMDNGEWKIDNKGKAKPDTKLRDYENIPFLQKDTNGKLIPQSIKEYFEREVKPHLPDAWIDEKKTKTGYEINFTKYFYEFKPLRSLAEIKADILALEESSLELEKKVLDG